MQARRFAEKNWHYVALLVIAVWMLATRVQGYENLIVDGTPMFNAVDAWYQYRTVLYTVEHWPNTIPYEIWSGFPTGTLRGQFGTLFDQVIATIAILIGGGNPSEMQVRYVMFFAPPVLGALTVFPVYYIARVVSGSRYTGVLAAALLSLFSGHFYLKTMVGFSEHNAAEPLGMAVAIAAFVWMISREEKDKTLVNLVGTSHRNKRLYKRAGAVGVALAFYMSIWPPSIFLVGIIGLIVGIFSLLIIPYYQKPVGDFSVPIGLATLVTAFIMLATMDTLTISVVAHGPLQVLFPLGVSALSLGSVILERKRRNYGEAWYTPAVFVGTFGLLISVAFAIISPEGISEVLRNIGEVFGLGLFAATRTTIAEAQPLSSFRLVFAFYGVTMFVAIFILPEVLLDGIYDGDDVLLFTGFWAVGLTLMGFTQVRFNYYLAIAVAVFGAYAIQRTVEVMNLSAVNSYDKQQAFIAIALLSIPLSLVGPLATVAVYNTVPQLSQQAQSWKPTAEWIEQNTPKEGQLEQPDATPLRYNERHGEVDDYEYPDGAYGIMTPLEAGHYITVFSKRIPVANPFQQHKEAAAQFFYAEDEQTARNVVEDELNGEQNERYVGVTWDIATPNSPSANNHLVHHPKRSESSYGTYITDDSGGFLEQGGRVLLKNQAYYDTMAARMYHYHGSRVPESSVVVRWNEDEDGSLTPPENEPVVEDVSSAEKANRIASSEQMTHDGGVGRYAPEPVPALQHYRLVRTGSAPATDDFLYNSLLQKETNVTSLSEDDFYTHPQFTKIFERVRGATITGTAPPNSTVNATATLKMQNGETFEYTQVTQADKEGKFSMTVPYSTTGYDNWGPEQGYTNVSTRATGPYTVQAGGCTSQVDVPEAAVIGEDNSSVEVKTCDL